jgi:hypothetical protein
MNLTKETKEIDDMFGEVIDTDLMWDNYYSVGTIPDIPMFRLKQIYKDGIKRSAYDETRSGSFNDPIKARDSLFRKIRAFIKYYTESDDHSKEKLLWRVRPEITSIIDFDVSTDVNYHGYARIYILLGE